jgi:protein-L-isoaspartate(D-aspartate) O-methyltransferase
VGALGGFGHGRLNRALLRDAMSDDPAERKKNRPLRHWPLSLDRLPGANRLPPAGRRSPAVPPSVPTVAFPVRRPQQAQALPPLPCPVPAVRSDFHAFRQRMVQRLHQAGCLDARVLAAMATVPRHLFVDSALVMQAYEDTSLPIGLGQTISKPSVVARMIELLRSRPGGTDLPRVLEIGTGCGYQAAVLAQVAGRVVTVERLKGLHERALRRLAPLALPGLELVYGDGRLGHAPGAPYDGIIAAAGGHDLPPAWLDQLARGGRLVAPVHDAALQSQVLMVVDRLADGSIVQRIHEPVRFVPLESGTSDSGHS